MLKGLIVFFILVVAAVGGVLYFGGVVGMDPAKEAADFKAAVESGLQQGNMTWEQVADVREPRRFIPIDYSNMTGERQPIDFDRDNLRADLAKGHYADGFKFVYMFTSEEQYEVLFAGSGKAVALNDVFTTGDLLRGEAFKR